MKQARVESQKKEYGERNQIRSEGRKEEYGEK
jgi:hypothetical protein